MSQSMKFTTAKSFSMSLAEVASILSAEQAGRDVTVNGISTDTRTITGGELFVALKGPHFDGHDFIDQALEKGAAACLVEHEVAAESYVVTADTHKALGLLARAWRQNFDKPVFAITGSNGKTTVKEMIASIAAQQKPVLATEGNLNNDIGVPLTLFRLNSEHDAAVIEMGANHIGEIEYLVNLAQPDIAVVTNAGSAHLEGFGGIEGVARAKGEIFSGLADDGVAIINADDQFAGYWKELAKARRVLTFGINNNADVMADLAASRTKHELTISSPLGNFGVKLKLLGQHNVMNALAATAAAIAAGYSVEVIVAGLEQLAPVKGRLQLKQGINHSQIIDDTYNANPSSFKAAINVLQDFPGKRFLALGDMAELGSNATELHKDAGIYAKEKGVDSLYSFGQLAATAAKEFGKNGFCYDKHEDMIDALRKELAQDVTLLVKGSRSMRMENVVNALTVAER